MSSKHGDPFDGFDDDDADERIKTDAAPIWYDTDDGHHTQVPIAMRPHEWGGLIMEILLDPKRIDKIVKAHGTSYDEVEELMKTNREFQIAIREARSRIRAHGPNSGFVLRTQFMAEDLLGDLYALAKNPATPPAVRLRAIENTVGWARLDPKLDKDRRDATDHGVHVSFNVIGLGQELPRVVSVEPTQIEKE